MNGFLIFCVTLSLTPFVSPCTKPRGWKELSLHERITAANTVVLGYVETLYPSKSTRPDYHSNDNTVTYIPNHYIAKVIVKCPLHGKYSKTIQRVFNLTDINTGDSCRPPTVVEKNQHYIFMLKGNLSQTELAPMEINNQSAVVKVTEPSMDVVRTEFGFDILMQEDNDYICKRATTPEKKLNRMDPAKVIGDGKTDDINAANTIAHGLLSLVTSFLICLLF